MFDAEWHPKYDITFRNIGS